MKKIDQGKTAHVLCSCQLPDLKDLLRADQWDIMGKSKKREKSEELRLAAIRAKDHRSRDHGQATWLTRKTAADSFLSAMHEVAAEKHIVESITKAYGVLLRYMWEANYCGACHSSSAILFALLSEMGQEARLYIGEVRAGGPYFDHSWVEVNGEVFDVAISLPQPGGADVGGPVFGSVDLKSGEKSSVKFGIADGEGLDKDALVPFENTLDGYAEVQRQTNGAGPDIWHRIEYLAPALGLHCTVQELVEKYGNVRREYRRRVTTVN